MNPAKNRSRARAVGIAVLAVIAIVVVSGAAFTVDMTEQAIITQFGKYIRTVKEPGLQFKMPFVQKVTYFEKRILVSDAQPGEYLSLDKKRLLVDNVTRWKVSDPLQFFVTVRTEAGALARLEPIVFSELRDAIASHNFSDIIAQERQNIMETVAASARTKAMEFGIDVIDVRIKRVDLPAEVQASVYARMTAERQRIGKRYRSEGAEEAFKIRAEADKQKTIIFAEAKKKSEQLRGEGEAEAIKIYAAAYEQDPEFYAFLRTLRAYESILDDKTTIVLDPSSELFRYLRRSADGGE
jgi:membrane protease subunit HflC